jgi:hypothetical protein
MSVLRACAEHLNWVNVTEFASVPNYSHRYDPASGAGPETYFGYAG